MYTNRKRAIPGKSGQANADFTSNLALCFSFVVFATWLVLLLLPVNILYNTRMYMLASFLALAYRKKDMPSRQHTAASVSLLL